jgi:hypothetical protein
VQGGQLVFGQTRIGKLVAVTGNAVSLRTVRLEGIERLEDERHTHLAEYVFVPLKVAPEGVVVVGIAADPDPEFFAGDWPIGGKEGGDQVDESFQPVHR